MPAEQNNTCPNPVPMMALMSGVNAPPLRTAIGFALIAACTAGFVSAMLLVGGWSDFSQIVLGAEALRQGQNPYRAVLIPVSNLPLVYPLPALLLGLPWTWLPNRATHPCFSAIGVGLLAYAHARTGPIERPSMVAFVSGAMFHTVISSQWSALLLGAALLPHRWIGGALLACKPTTAIWLWAMRPSWRAIGGALMATAVSLAVRPSWPREWWEVSRIYTSYAVAPALGSGSV